ncbi:WxL domain-containing protein [Pediococcus pentosaceus]|uniref:WxL domain-containing protein n=1 Tax=Pediococcus pentosaceus TaxID=1255 RepID=UPI000D00660B|nr:WxL domain-containing protein [Pediococcus pentosaceus]AVL01545.1 cell surface protein [Pediococcus pentosaceus]MBF7133936.1 WxL domain-containing protein [Pediococcus pentosaceus]QPT35675.1 WxL domain-containing protein [Pediococcus pentosaceus]
MNKMMLTTIAIGVFAINTNTAMASQISEVTNHTDVTLTAGSGKDVYPVVPDDTHDDDSGTGDMGSLTIPYASNITFGEHEIKQADANYYALNQKPHVQVNDTRGGAKGWSLGVAITPFVGANGKELVGAQMSLSNGKVVTKNNKSAMPKITQDSFKLNRAYQVVMTAKEGEGAGAFAAVFEGKNGNNENVKLHVPRAGVEAQSYSAELTWVLTDTPS